MIDKITTISFDADDTLWDFEGVMHHALGCALTELRRLVPSVPDSLSIHTLIAIRNQVAEEQKDNGLTLEAIRLEAFKRTLQFIEMPNDDLAAYLNALYLKHRFEDIQFFDDVLPVLNALQGHYMMGVFCPMVIPIQSAVDWQATSNSWCSLRTTASENPIRGFLRLLSGVQGARNVSCYI